MESSVIPSIAGLAQLVECQLPNVAGGTAKQVVAPPCATEHDANPDRDSPCSTVRQDESSRIVTDPRAERTDSTRTAGVQPNEVAVTASPSPTAAGRAPEARVDDMPMTSEEALRLAIKLAVDESDFDRAAVLLDAAKRTRPRAVTRLEAVRGRGEDSAHLDDGRTRKHDVE